LGQVRGTQRLSGGAGKPHAKETEAMADRFRYYLRVRFAECDAQRVVFNAHYGLYIEIATMEFVRAMGFADVLVNGPLDYQLVKQTFEWKSPARFDQVVEVSLWAKALGNTSFTLAAEFRIAGAPDVLATAETVYVLVDGKTLVKMPLPDDLRAALEQGAAGLHIDHADSTARRGSRS
jgi:acyl-CoA thioester hydrolase